MQEMTDLPIEIKHIIGVANEFMNYGESTSSQVKLLIAAAFVLNNMQYLPEICEDVVDAWEYLGDWQVLVKQIKRYHLHLIVGYY